MALVPEPWLPSMRELRHSRNDRYIDTETWDWVAWALKWRHYNTSEERCVYWVPAEQGGGLVPSAEQGRGFLLKMINKKAGSSHTAQLRGSLANLSGSRLYGEAVSRPWTAEGSKLWCTFPVYTIIIHTQTIGGLCHPLEPHPGRLCHFHRAGACSWHCHADVGNTHPLGVHLPSVPILHH